MKPASPLVILTTSPTGLGHIRVMQALQQGVPEDLRVEVVGADDRFMRFIHRVSSRNVWLRRSMEFLQTNPMAEEKFFGWYADRIRKPSKILSHQLYDVVSRAWPTPREVVIVNTHPGIAHQIVAIRGVLQEQLKTRIKLAVVVTDDSPQRMWAVPGVDLLFVPSLTTKNKLTELFKHMGFAVPQIEVVAYPVSLVLGKKLDKQEFHERVKQVDPSGYTPLSVMVPVSGAAVQLDYFRELITALSGGTFVSVVARESKHTHAFLDWAQDQANVEVHSSTRDEAVVSAYERVMSRHVFALEVTKPSEQAFKVLYTPKQQGGALLMLSEPVGRQEYDNIAFLRRHGLLPSEYDQALLDQLMLAGKKPEEIDAALFDRANDWRAILLPKVGWQAGLGIVRLRATGVLAAMTDFGGFMKGHEELGCLGVKRVWEKMGVT